MWPWAIKQIKAGEDVYKVAWAVEEYGPRLQDDREGNKLKDFDLNQHNYREFEDWARYTYEDQPMDDSTVVYTFPDGWTIRELQSEDDCEIEGNTMNNCIDQEDEYHWSDKISEGYLHLFSLRDDKNHAHASIEATNSWPQSLTIVQEHGKNNKPPLPKYQAYIDTWKKSLEAQGMHVGEGSHYEPWHGDEDDEDEYNEPQHDPWADDTTEHPEGSLDTLEDYWHSLQNYQGDFQNGDTELIPDDEHNTYYYLTPEARKIDISVHDEWTDILNEALQAEDEHDQDEVLEKVYALYNAVYHEQQAHGTYGQQGVDELLSDLPEKAEAQLKEAYHQDVHKDNPIGIRVVQNCVNFLKKLYTESHYVHVSYPTAENERGSDFEASHLMQTQNFLDTAPNSHVYAPVPLDPWKQLGAPIPSEMPQEPVQPSQAPWRGPESPETGQLFTAMFKRGGMNEEGNEWYPDWEGPDSAYAQQQNDLPELDEEWIWHRGGPGYAQGSEPIKIVGVGHDKVYVQTQDLTMHKFPMEDWMNRVREGELQHNKTVPDNMRHDVADSLWPDTLPWGEAEQQYYRTANAQFAIGDIVRSGSTDDYVGQIIDVRTGLNGPAYVVRFNNGHTSLLDPLALRLVEPSVHVPDTLPWSEEEQQYYREAMIKVADVQDLAQPYTRPNQWVNREDDWASGERQIRSGNSVASYTIFPNWEVANDKVGLSQPRYGPYIYPDNGGPVIYVHWLGDNEGRWMTGENDVRDNLAIMLYLRQMNLPLYAQIENPKLEQVAQRFLAKTSATDPNDPNSHIWDEDWEKPEIGSQWEWTTAKQGPLYITITGYDDHGGVQFTSTRGDQMGLPGPSWMIAVDRGIMKRPDQGLFDSIEAMPTQSVPDTLPWGEAEQEYYRTSKVSKVLDEATQQKLTQEIEAWCKASGITIYWEQGLGTSAGKSYHDDYWQKWPDAQTQVNQWQPAQFHDQDFDDPEARDLAGGRAAVDDRAIIVNPIVHDVDYLAAMHEIGERRARDAGGIDAEMRIEAAVLDGDKRLRQMGRQILQRDIGARHFAACGDDAAVHAGDLDGRGTLRNFQRLDWRQMRADPDDYTGTCDDGPQAKHRAPVDEAAPAGSRAVR